MRALFLQFEAEDPPGRLGAGLEALGARCETIRLYKEGHAVPDVESVDLVIALGGYMNAEDEAHFPFLRTAVELLQEAHRRDLPALGVCLGGQILARALGGRVWRKPVMEIGYFPIALTTEGAHDPLFRGLPAPLLTFQWHEDAFDPPPGATLLADSPRDTAQAFRIGSCYGIQFHPEVETETVARWARGAAAILPDAADPTSAEALAERGAAVEARFAAQTMDLCRNLATIARAHRDKAGSAGGVPTRRGPAPSA